jgi:hypothetical protein
MDIKLLEKELLKLSTKDKALITYKLLESLEADNSEGIEEIWLNEALLRYHQIENKSLIDSELVIKEAKLKYK